MMKLLSLDNLPDQQSMLIFHALARLGFEGLIIVSPQKPLASIGYFQDAAKEVDLDYCKNAGIPVMRREVGGGATYLDGDQIFYQLIWKKGNKRFPTRIKDIFPYLSQPVCETYHEFGIETRFRPENDIVTTKEKKIAGEGGGDIGESMVFVGGILMDFDYRTMSKILKVPEEKFRDKIHKSMEEHVTTMKRELGTLPQREDVVQSLIKNYEVITGKLTPLHLTQDIVDKMIEIEQWFTSPEFLFKKTPRLPTGVKIREGVEILYSTYKARGGLIRTAQEIQNNVIKDIGISGDFQLYPKSELTGLEHRLQKSKRKEHVIISKVEDFYEKHKIESPGVEPEDVTEAIMEAKAT
ncbi:MAG: lipoate--protein ligase family protein [Candidatus Thermoplasmatota archaeon]|nr:lipoate--protein ligase family protein [Candidatus Thermoplasmatota archaeon]